MVLGDPGLVVALVSASGDSGRFGAGQGLSSLDRLLALLAGARSALGLGEEGLDPGLVDEVEGAAEDPGQEDIQEDSVQGWLAGQVRSSWLGLVCDVHLGVKDAGGGLDDASQTVVSLDLEDLALGVSDDGQKADNNILGLHVQNERERQRLGLASRDLDVVLDSGQVAEDTGHWARILRQWLCGRQRSADEGKVNWLVLMIRDLDDRLGRVPVDELDTKARVGEVRGDIDL